MPPEGKPSASIACWRDYRADGKPTFSHAVTPLLGDDNWGNLMAVMPEGKDHPAGGGIYYHADCESFEDQSSETVN